MSKILTVDDDPDVHTQSSFLLDFDEPSVEAATRELSSGPARPSPAAIEAFVNRYIVDKTYARGFDIASRVAQTQSGDCTEHAVLAAALLRKFGYPARVIFGLTILGVATKADTSLSALGHAWAEYFDGGEWKRVDAALNALKPDGSGAAVGVPGLPRDAKLRLAYLPITVLKDEGPGFARVALDEHGIMSVKAIRVDAVP
jgi:transglutaminase-like putative cysteine protease